MKILEPIRRIVQPSIFPFLGGTSSSVTNYVISNNTGASFGGVVDVKIRELDPTTNYGSDTIIATTSWTTGDVEKTAIKFGGLASVPSGTVSNAKVRLYCVSINNFPVAQAYALSRAFVELQATWIIAQTAVNWGTAGASNTSSDYVNTLLGSVTVNATGAYFELTGSGLTSYVQSIVSGGTDHGLILVEEDWTAPAGLSIFADYTSSNGTDGQRPELTFTLTT